jgi:hypothetical protein
VLSLVLCAVCVQEEIKFSKDYRKVPIARVGPDTVNDSTAIVQRLQVGTRLFNHTAHGDAWHGLCEWGSGSQKLCGLDVRRSCT